MYVLVSNARLTHVLSFAVNTFAGCCWVQHTPCPACSKLKVSLIGRFVKTFDLLFTGWSGVPGTQTHTNARTHREQHSGLHTQRSIQDYVLFAILAAPPLPCTRGNNVCGCSTAVTLCDAVCRTLCDLASNRDLHLHKSTLLCYLESPLRHVTSQPSSQT